MDVREVLISIATAALVAAEADAAQTGQLIFRDEWRPTTRTRNSTTQPQSTGAQSQSLSWLAPILNHLGLSGGIQPQQDQPSSPSPPTTLPAPAPAPPVPASPPAAVPASPAPPKCPPQPQLQDDAVGKLLEDNDDVFDRLINHPFPRALGDGSASLDGFRYFMIQDTLYLEICARLKMLAVARSPNFKDVENFGPRHDSSLGYVRESKKTLISMLGVSEDIIVNTPRSKCLDASEKYYMNSVQDEDAFFAYYVVLLPCVLSYWKIAERLMSDSSTVRNVVYHPAWTEVNHDPSSAEKYTKFINANIMAKDGVGLNRWNTIFRTACQLEAEVFNTGLQAPTPYQIVPNGTYSVQSTSAAGRVVLANQNVERFLVVGVNKKGGNNEKWHVVVTKGGYTFRNVETGHYLGIATELNRKEGRILQAVVKPHYWWINPVRSQPSKGSLLYQIYHTGNLRYTLHADSKSVDRVESTTPIIACENVEGSCQMWSFELEQDVVNPRIHGEETRQEPPKEMDKETRKMAELIKKYEQILQEEFEEIEQFRAKYSEKLGGDTFNSLKRMARRLTAKEATEWLAVDFNKYERVVTSDLNGVEQHQRRKTGNERRWVLLEEVRKATDREGRRRMVELIEKYERMLQKEFQAIEQLRNEHIEERIQELQEEARKRMNKMKAGAELAKIVIELIDKYLGKIREELEAGGRLRKVYHSEVMQELLVEAT